MTLNASVSGPVVYLDNWAIYDLAESDSARRKRFIDAIRSGMDLLFSVTNVAELWGPQGRSADAVREFLDDIGPRWFPVELSPIDVIQRELNGLDPNAVCISESFLKSYVAHRMRSRAGEIVVLSDDFFCLGSILDYVGPQRDSLREGSAEFDEMLKNKMGMLRDRFKQDPVGLERVLPLVPFHPTRRAFFVYNNFLRIIASEADSLKKGDGMDFCHAVMACAFGSFATLDKRWKRRADSLPKPNQLARTYSPLELEQMVTDMEDWLKHREGSLS